MGKINPDHSTLGRWVLIELLATKRVRKPIYFKAMTVIGPCGTGKLDEAAKFTSQIEAKMCPAYVHSFSAYEPSQIA